MTDLSEALELAESFHDGTDYNFDRLTPDEQEEIIAAARRWDALDSDENVEAVADALIEQLRKGELRSGRSRELWLADARAALRAVQAGGES